ncbi:hypothetical protein [Sporosarcina sp. FSL K6-1508]|uniref:hypothetical protein n=1 Tax=Sporosarcina sp. FSL K6-1508 TaxID=2921553 RepID=UPI0030F5786A
MEKQRTISNDINNQVSYWFLFFDMRNVEGNIEGHLKCGFTTLSKMELDLAKNIISAKVNSNILMCEYGGKTELPKGFTEIPEYKIE